MAKGGLIRLAKSPAILNDAPTTAAEHRASGCPMQRIHDNKGQHSQTYQIEDAIHALPQRQQSRDRLTPTTRAPTS